MSYVDPSAAGTPTTGQPVSSQWGRDVQGDVEFEETQILGDSPLVVNASVHVGVLAAPTSTVGTWVVAGGASPVISNTSAAQNDTATWTLSLVAGTYDFRIIGVSAANGGQVQFALDGTNIGSVVDLFNTTSALITGVSVSAKGAHTLKATVSAKNVSSSGYLATLVQILATRRS